MNGPTCHFCECPVTEADRLANVRGVGVYGCDDCVSVRRIQEVTQAVADEAVRLTDEHALSIVEAVAKEMAVI